MCHIIVGHTVYRYIIIIRDEAVQCIQYASINKCKTKTKTNVDKKYTLIDMKYMHFKAITVIQGLGQFIGLTSNMSMDFLFRFLNPITVTDKKIPIRKRLKNK